MPREIRIAESFADLSDDDLAAQVEVDAAVLGRSAILGLARRRRMPIAQVIISYVDSDAAREVVRRELMGNSRPRMVIDGRREATTSASPDDPFSSASNPGPGLEEAYRSTGGWQGERW